MSPCDVVGVWMFKQTAVLAVAVASALAAAQGMAQIMGPRPAAAAPLVAVAVAAPRGSLAKAADGHFWADAEVDGGRVRMLVDTGASAVSLTASDARRLGVDLSMLDFDRPLATAGGVSRAAAIVLDHVDVGGARVEQVSALVVRSGLPASLLGMSYLGRLSRLEATPTALVLQR